MRVLMVSAVVCPIVCPPLGFVAFGCAPVSRERKKMVGGGGGGECRWLSLVCFNMASRSRKSFTHVIHFSRAG
jgi:hypothetical protein